MVLVSLSGGLFLHGIYKFKQGSLRTYSRWFQYPMWLHLFPPDMQRNAMLLLEDQVRALCVIELTEILGSFSSFLFACPWHILKRLSGRDVDSPYFRATLMHTHCLFLVSHHLLSITKERSCWCEMFTPTRWFDEGHRIP